jgi:CubicO group peptidase (beta-lactamase class C family)
MIMSKMPVLLMNVLTLLLAQQLSAQTNAWEKRDQQLIQWLNQHQLDSVYAISSPAFHGKVSIDQLKTVATTQIYPLLPFTNPVAVAVGKELSKYKVNAKSGTIMLQMMYNKEGQLEGFTMPPFSDSAKQPVTAMELRNDLSAQDFLRFYNAKQTDSLTSMASEGFLKRSKMTKETFANVFETQLYQYGTITNMEFLSSRNEMNVYKCALSSGLILDLLIAADSQRMMNAWGMRPHQDETAPKKSKFDSDNKKQTALDKIVDSVLAPYMLKQQTVGACVGVFYKGKTYFYHYGETKRNQKTPTTNQTLFEIGSISKTFVATLLAEAVVKQKLKLDDPITNYLPDSVKTNKALQSVQLRHLSNHTSGLPRLPDNFEFGMTDPKNPYKDYDVKLMMQALKNVFLESKPGAKYAYSNFAVGVLCTILERVNGQSFEQLLQSKIAMPLQLKNTHAALLKANEALAATTYDEQGGETGKWDFQSMAGAGSIMSNVEDMLKYGMANLQLKPDGLKPVMQMTQRPSYHEKPNIVGLGWHFDEDENGQPRVMQHSGGTYGSLSHLAIDKKTKTVVVVLTNNSAGGDALGVQLIRKLIGL